MEEAFNVCTLGYWMTFYFPTESHGEYLRNDKAKTLDVSANLADRSLMNAVTR
jgi:hypothetical protein